MSLKALICPQCGANLQLDDNREFGFCEFCGAKVQIKEVIEIKHSGQIKIDNKLLWKHSLSVLIVSFVYQYSYIIISTVSSGTLPK